MQAGYVNFALAMELIGAVLPSDPSAEVEIQPGIEVLQGLNFGAVNIQYHNDNERISRRANKKKRQKTGESIPTVGERTVYG